MKLTSLFVCAAISAASLSVPAFAGSDAGFSANARNASAASKAERKKAASQERVCYAQAGGCTGLSHFTKTTR